MSPEERKKAATDLAGMAARGLDIHFRDHGPDSSHVVRAAGGGRYEVAETMTGGAVSFVEHRGERFAVNVIPLGGQGDGGPLFTYEPQGGPA